MVKFDKSLHQEIGKQLKEARIKKGMSLQDMSDAIGGIKTKQTIMRYENGDTRIEAEVMKEICRVLGLDCDDVIRKAEMARYFSHISLNAGKPATAKLAKDQPKNTLLEAYEQADEKTKKAVRILLGIEE